MNTTFLAVISALLIMRIPYHYRDESRPFQWLLLKAFAETALLFFILGWSSQARWAVFLNLIANAVEIYWEKKSIEKNKTPYFARTIPFFLALAAISFYLPHNGLPSAFIWIKEQLPALTPSLAFHDALSKIHWQKALLILVGILLCLVEANTFVRLVIDKLSLKPTDQHTDIADLPTRQSSTYNRGRIIGIMERLLIYKQQ